MNISSILNKYYPEENELKTILLIHSKLVRDKALKVVEIHPEFSVDTNFIAEAAMVHDIGIFLTNAPRIFCFGEEPYIRHGYLGAELMRKEGFPKHASVCERHTGTGLTLEEIVRQNLPLPHQDFSPITLEEQIICYADKFYSKTKPYEEKTVEQVRNSLVKFGIKSIKRFDQWQIQFS